MATPPNTHGAVEVREKPTQGVFIGWLALGLLSFAVCGAAFGLIAGASHGWQ